MIHTPLDQLFALDLIEEMNEVNATQEHSKWCAIKSGAYGAKCDCGLSRIQSIIANAPKAKGKLKAREGMTRPEKRYAERLIGMQLIGVIHWYAFEPIKLRLADNTTYTPDFLILAQNGGLECHEVKGSKTVQLKSGKASRPWCEEDAKIKIKVAAEMYPFRFVMAWEDEQGTWHHKDYSANAD